MAFQKKGSDAADRAHNPWLVKELASRLKNLKHSELDDFIVIGIDFGTTYDFFFMTQCQMLFRYFLMGADILVWHGLPLRTLKVTRSASSLAGQELGVRKARRLLSFFMRINASCEDTQSQKMQTPFDGSNCFFCGKKILLQN